MTKDNFKVLFTNASYYKSDDKETWDKVLEKWEEFRDDIINGLPFDKWSFYTEDSTNGNNAKDNDEKESLCRFIIPKDPTDEKECRKCFRFFGATNTYHNQLMVYSTEENEKVVYKMKKNGKRTVEKEEKEVAENYYNENIKPLLRDWVLLSKNVENLKCLDRLSDNKIVKTDEEKKRLKNTLLNGIKQITPDASGESLSSEEKEKRVNNLVNMYNSFSMKAFFTAIAILESLRKDADENIKNKLMWITSRVEIVKIAEMFEIKDIENKSTLELNSEVYQKAKEWAGIKEPNKEQLINLGKLLWDIRNDSKELFTDFCSPNVIFCGAPSTGKTYTVKQTIETLQKIAPEFYPSTPAAKYTQFHPSYTYQDFIEGIKPTGMTTDGNLKLEPMNGTFKQFCIDVKKANEEHLDDLIKEKFKGESITINYEAKFKADKIPNDTEFEKVKNDLVKEITSDEDLNTVMENLKNIITSDEELNTVKDTLVIKNNTITNVIKDESNSHITINYVTIYTVDEKLSDENFQKVKKHLIDNNKIKIADLIDPDDPETLAKWPHYYYVVDEINRGDLSNIFGETFTLLEYRDYDFSGIYTESHNCLVETTLSNLIKNLEGNEKKKLIYKQLENGDVVFGIPFNIHFIGMMNDVDRSIDAFDLAFRRRFRWEYTYCNYKLIKNELIDKGLQEEAEGYVESCRRLNYMLTGNEYDKKDGSIESQNLGLTYQIGHGFFLKILKIKRNDFKKRKEFLFDNYIKGTVKEYLMQNISDHKKLDEMIKNIREGFVNEPK